MSAPGCPTADQASRILAFGGLTPSASALRSQSPGAFSLPALPPLNAESSRSDPGCAEPGRRPAGTPSRGSRPHHPGCRRRPAPSCRGADRSKAEAEPMPAPRRKPPQQGRSPEQPATADPRAAQRHSTAWPSRQAIPCLRPKQAMHADWRCSAITARRAGNGGRYRSLRAACADGQRRRRAFWRSLVFATKSTTTAGFAIGEV